MSLPTDFAHKKIPLEDILSATNNFSDQNLIKEGGVGRIYKGQLLDSGEIIDIVARRLDPMYEQGNKEFLTLISMLSSLNHPNLVSFIGFCDENEEKIIISKYEVNSSLDKYLSDPTLTWMQRLKICVGIAHAISYIYYDKGRDFSVIHRNIKSSKILLNEKWEPKLSGFEHSVRHPAARRDRHLVTELSGSYGYVDPSYAKTGTVSHKSDLFSFGVVLLEVLCGKRAFVPDENEERSLMFTMKRLEHINIPKDRLLSQLVKSHYEKKKLDDIINRGLRKQMDQQSYEIFSKTAYYCLKEERAKRPDIDPVLYQLEKALNLQSKYEHDQKRLVVVEEVKENTSSNHSKAPLMIAEYSFLSRNPPAIEQLHFLSGNLATNHANGNMYFSLRDFAGKRIPFEDISSSTSNFADKNVLPHSGVGKLYKGQLKWDNRLIKIVARRLEGKYGQKEIELWTEISKLSSLKHKNIVSIVGFCDENGENIIIYEHTGHGCLDQYLSNPAFTWSQRVKMCLSVASVLTYLHYNFVHGDISSSNILIDEDWEAKVFGFGLSTEYPGNWEHRLLFSHYFETSAYRDPVYTNTFCVTPKYDVYSFGMLVYEVLCGGKTMVTDYGVNEKLNEMIHPDLREQMDTQSFTILSKIAYNCLNRQCLQRPSMDQIFKELQDALNPQTKPENLEHSTVVSDEPISSIFLTKEIIDCLKIPLSDIELATNMFQTRIGSGAFGRVYKAELDHFDIQNISSMDLKNKDELPKKRSVVAIKRIFNMEAGEQAFRAEIEILASCNHPNIVSLLGFSGENREMIFVFEFVSKGSLSDCLEKKALANVGWAKRIQICIDVANGLKYLHADLPGKRRILHRDVKSANILLDENWNAKVADFGLSKFHPVGKTLMSAIDTKHRVGTSTYVDPEYAESGIYAQSSDIYSFGVVLFEILSGRLAHEFTYKVENEEGYLALVAVHRYKDGTIKELIDPDMMEEVNEHIFTVNKGPNQKSLEAFTNIAYECLSKPQKERPKLELIIKKLEDALHFQGKDLVFMKFQLSNIRSATNNFSAKYCVGVGAYGIMYNAELDYFDRKSLSEIEGKKSDEPAKIRKNVALKRILDREDGHGKQGFFREIDMLGGFNHPSIVSLLGVSSENREMIIIYENAFKGSLHDCLGNACKMAKLTWTKRIQISLDIAHGFSYLQTSIEDKQRLTQFPMNSGNILLDDKWRAKIACFWLSILDPAANKKADNIVEDPEFIEIEKLKSESDVFSFGVILFEIMCGKSQYDEIYFAKNEKGLPTIARRCFDEGTILKEIIDPILKEETDEKGWILSEEVDEGSFEAFLYIAYKCCAAMEADRPRMEDIIQELEKALNIQVEYLKHLKNQAVETVNNLNLLKIPLDDILLATKDFSEQYLIGRGGFSEVYKSELGYFDGIMNGGKDDMLERHRTVAIKRIRNRHDEYAEQGFFAEIEALANSRHPNIVSLLGFCDERSEMILVLEYASNGSLDTFLEDLDNMINISWIQRIQICLDIAHGLHYLHTGTDDKQVIIHRDVKSANILLDENMVAKIADFGLCKLNHAYQQFSSMKTVNIAGTQFYLDPEYMRTGKLKRESDIYSFGVVLFEILCGRLAYDKKFIKEAEHGLAPIARKCFIKGTLKQIIDPRMGEDDENIFMLNGTLNQDSLDTFSRIAYQCVAESQSKRPSIKLVIEELTKAFNLQKNPKDKLQMSLEDIQFMTENFGDHKCIGEGRYWKQYEGEMVHYNGYTTVVVKRFDSKSDKQRHHFMKELQTLYEYKHVNIIGVAGYCQDMDEKTIVYEHASNGRLNEHLDDTRVTWMSRLKIGIDVACGLQFLHTGGVTKDIPIMHRDIKSACILLDGDWTAKLSNLELSINSWEREASEHVNDNAYGSLGYLDPEYKQSGYLTQKSDIYSLGVVLLEMLCGRLAWVEGSENPSQSLVSLAKEYFKEGKVDDLVFEGIKEQIDTESLATFADIALRCLKDDSGERPEAGDVVIQLNKAVEFQEDIDIWEPKLPKDYEELLRFSDVDKNTRKKDVYDKLRKGVLLRDRELCLSLGSNGEKHYTVSAKKFSYRNRWALNWRRIPESRFENVAEMLTILNLNIKIKIRTLFLSTGVNYGACLVFKFCGTRKLQDKSMYVNLTYKLGSETFHAYFATMRDEEWMTIELCRFLTQEEDTNFEVLLESFSSYYCGRNAIYIEGIEFRVIENVEYEETERGQVQHMLNDSNEILRRSQENKLFSLNEVNKKKQLMLSAKEVLYNSSNVKHIHLNPSAESGFQEVIELLAEQVLRISCKIENKMLSQDTEYSCYLVFKLSEDCHGMHCPVRVRDLYSRRNKEVRNIYLRSPSPWNLHDINHIPVQRDDGWMEVNVWNFNSNHKTHYDCFWVKLKLISYEGTMAGLIVSGLEFRPT